MNFIVLNVLKPSIGALEQSCGVQHKGISLSSKTEEVEMAINTANINFCEPNGKDTSHIVFTNGLSIDVLCPFEGLITKINPQVHQ